MELKLTKRGDIIKLWLDDFEVLILNPQNSIIIPRSMKLTGINGRFCYKDRTMISDAFEKGNTDNAVFKLVQNECVFPELINCLVTYRYDSEEEKVLCSIKLYKSKFYKITLFTGGVNGKKPFVTYPHFSSNQPIVTRRD